MRTRLTFGTWGAVVLTLGALACLTTPHAAAQPPAAPAGEEAAVRAAAQEYLQALARGDAARLRTLWTADGDYVDAAGNAFRAQDLIRQIETAGSSDASTEAPTLPASTLRFIQPGVAIEDGTIGPTDPGASTGRYTAVWVKRDGRWLLDALRETAAGDASAPTGNPKLRPLDWLVGAWAAQADDATVLMSWHWSDGGAYLVGEFALYRDGQPIASGSQRIGWDAAVGQIKSWMFDSQGGSGDGTWRADGKRWVVDAAHVTADGLKAKATTTYTPGQDASFVWEVVGDWQGAKPDTAKLPAQRLEFRRAAAAE